MKKTLLLIFTLAAFTQAKAQQLFQFKPADSLGNNPLQKYFDLKPDVQSQLFKPQISLGQLLAAQVKVSAYDHMPIANLTGFSKMPVVKLDGTDRMPVLKLGDPGTVVIDDKKITP